ncbi:unnamed protein product [Rotaria sp. Silwood2]|nr:unnamed protein product [Rotaria sp. Silwood2]
MMVKKILVTGASGLIGRVLTEHLSTNPNYDIYGIDRHTALSIHYELENTTSSEEPKPLLSMKDRFFICDINDKDKLARIIQDNKINVIIHLAAVLIGSIEQYEHVNCHGTQILFDIATKQDHVEMIIYASSVRTVFGYLQNEPYSLLAKNIKPQQSLKKITINDQPNPSDDDPLSEAYSKSKIYGEALARQYSSVDGNNVKFICARFGWINTTNNITSPSHNWADKSLWCSYRDLCQFFDRVLENQLKLKNFQIYFVSSNNDFCWVNMK